MELKGDERDREREKAKDRNRIKSTIYMHQRRQYINAYFTFICLFVCAVFLFRLFCLAISFSIFFVVFFYCASENSDAIGHHHIIVFETNEWHAIANNLTSIRTHTQNVRR